MSLKKEFNAIKKELFPFVYNVTKYAVQQPFLQLIDNFQENNIVEKKATQLEYKSKQKGNKLFINDRWFASSKTCCSCGNQKKDLTLSDRIYYCDECKLEIDRDLNASINLHTYLF